MVHPIPVQSPVQGYARTQVVCLDRAYGDVLPDWVNNIQTSPGEPLLEHREVVLPGLELAYVYSAVANVEHYRIPEGETHFSLDLDLNAPIISWTGHESLRSARQTIAIHRTQVEYTGVTPPGWRCLYICMDNALLEQLDLLPTSIWKKSQDPQEALLGFNLSTLDHFRSFIQAWFAPFAHPHEFTAFSPVQASVLWLELTETLQLLFDLSEASREAFMFDKPSRRYRYFCDACVWIEAHLEQPLTVEILAKHLHVTPRALQYAFRDIAATSVAKYIQARRLHGVRETLLSGQFEGWDTHGGAEPSIAAIARHYGFNHLGRFAQQFQQHFGVLPRQLRSRRS